MKIVRRAALYCMAIAFVLTGCARSQTAAPRAAATQAALLPPLTPGLAGHITIGPYIQPAEPDLSTSMRIVWWSDAAGAGRLDWREVDGTRGGSVATQTEEYEGLTRHVARVDRPKGGKGALKVLATVTVDGKAYTAGPLTMAYAPARCEPLRFAAVGDTGAGTKSEQRVVDQLAAANISLLLITGDDAYDHGNWGDYTARFFPFYKNLMASVPILPALGNHDVGNPQHMGQPFRMVWTPPGNWSPPPGATQPYSLNGPRSNGTKGPVPPGEATLRNYSADAGDCHFICLDSTADRNTIQSLVIPWLTQDLADAKKHGAKWLIAYWHHPPYTHGGYKDTSVQWKDIRDLYLPVLKAAGVQLVLNGHDHGFQRMVKDGITYIITAGGGASLYGIDPDYTGNDQPPLLAYNNKVRSFTLLEQSADGSALNIRQIDENGKKLDEVTLTLGQPPA